MAHAYSHTHLPPYRTLTPRASPPQALQKELAEKELRVRIAQLEVEAKASEAELEVTRRHQRNRKEP